MSSRCVPLLFWWWFVGVIAVAVAVVVVVAAAAVVAVAVTVPVRCIPVQSALNPLYCQTMLCQGATIFLAETVR